MTQRDIDEKTADFVRAALMAREAGFDAVEIHAGHGYLLSQFVSLGPTTDATNTAGRSPTGSASRWR